MQLIHEYMEGIPQEAPKAGKPERIIEVCACAICKRSNITLLRREETYVCAPCYRRLLSLRALNGKQKGSAEI